jgi:hypothetical protein
VYDPPALADVRRRAADQLARFHPGVRRFLNPHQYPVGLERRLHDLKTKLILEARGPRLTRRTPTSGGAAVFRPNGAAQGQPRALDRP